MDILGIDFETYYDQQYNLSKMTTEDYLRDPRFEAIGVSVKRNKEKTQWFSGTKAQIKEWLDQWNWDNGVCLAHNNMFDAAILSWHFDIRPRRLADTLSMLRAVDGPDAGNSLATAAERYELGEKGKEVLKALGKRRIDFTVEELKSYGRYCIKDTDLVVALFDAIIPNFPVSELRLIDMTLRMFTEPTLELDRGALVAHLNDVQTRKARLLDKALVDKTQIMSNPKLAALLTQLGVDPPQKVSVKTSKLTWAFGKTDEGFKALLDHEDPRVQAIVAARLGVKSTLEETRTERFINIAARGTLPVPLRYYAAHTGRWGGDDKVNLQNLPRKSLLKKAIIAPPGYTFIDCDSSQIEARTLAWLAGQTDLVEFFQKNNDEIAAGVLKKDMQFDPYKIMASQIYGVAVGDVTDDQRFVGKTTILGAGYSMGHIKFRAQLKAMGVSLDESECARIIAIYRETYPMIPLLWKEAQQAIMAMIGQQTTSLGRPGVVTVNLMGIRLPNGLYLKYPNLRAEENPDTNRLEFVYDQKKGRTSLTTRIYGGKLVENVCQALARIVIGEQMLMVSRQQRVVMTVHDAVGSLVPTAMAEAGRAYVEQCMRTQPKWAVGLPLNCESKMGSSYGG